MTTIIVFVYPAYRSQIASYTRKRILIDIKRIPKGLNRIENTTLPTLHHSFSQYLWCVNHYGPNNQLKDFVKCGAIAMMNNYTLVLPPLYAHHSQKTRNIQWFEHFYDSKQLSQAVNLIAFEQLLPKIMISPKQIMIDCYIQQIALIANRVWYSRNALMSIQNHYRAKFVFHHSINLSRNFHLNELFNKAKNCSSIFLHIHYTKFNNFFSLPNTYVKLIFEHLHRTALIQRIASQSIQLLPKLAIGRNRSQAHLKTLAAVHMRLGDYTVMSISAYIKQILYLINTDVRISHLYIMCPYLNATSIQQLTDSLPVPFTATHYLFQHLSFALDHYLFDVLEQEIAHQAPVFIASPWTTYSATILMQKVYQQKGTVYMLSEKSSRNPFLVTKRNAKYFKK